MQAATVVINRRALRHNLQRLRELAPASKMVAVVKANAYGHGLLETARTLPDADAFGVARLEEALRLRAGGITKPVLLLEGFFDARDLPTISAQHFHTAVHNEEQLAALEEASLDEPVTVWMKLDTGMHRLGVRPEQAEAFYHRLTQCKNVRQPVNIGSHFARADEPKCGATEKQLAIFNTFCEGKPGQRSIAASGGILLWPQSHFDWVRPGIILYGVSPLEDRSTGADFGCQPVMSLTSSLIAVSWRSRDGLWRWLSARRAVRYASAGERSRSTDCRARGDGYDLRRLRSTSAGQSRGSGHFMGRRFARRTYR